MATLRDDREPRQPREWTREVWAVIWDRHKAGEDVYVVAAEFGWTKFDVIQAMCPAPVGLW